MKKFLAILLAMMLVMVSVTALASGSDPVAENDPTATPTDGDGDGESEVTPSKSKYYDLPEEELTDKYESSLDVKLTLTKSFTVENGTAPAQTFTFKFTPVSYVNGAGEKSTKSEDIPAIGNQTIAYDSEITEDTDKTFTLGFDLDKYELGVYTYEIEEVIPETKIAGMDYEDTKMYLVLTILADGTTTTDAETGDVTIGKQFVAALHKGSTTGEKDDIAAENNYASGKLTVTKQTEGNLADLSKKFTFTITFIPESRTTITDAQKDAIAIEGVTGSWSTSGLTYTVQLADDDSITFSNIPQRTTYTVTEEKQEYTHESADEVFSDSEKKISSGDADTVVFTNTLETKVDTGITLETLPYVLMMALAMMGLVALKLRKREEY